MIGWNGNGVYRVLKIDQLDASELNLGEDFTAYTKKECNELLKRIHKENKATGGLKFVTLCYGIIENICLERVLDSGIRNHLRNTV
ncbi:unnamed protein product [Brassica rapa]|uniref:Uncharacterized protein n=1 Tax=Brassica campestris TaxID=3711 RepID=A0A8D9I4F0_BRACM|nr:unnamed protein product [Brassica rapa]